MTDKLLTAIITIIVAIIGLALLSVLLGRGSDTAGVIQALTGGLAQQFGTLQKAQLKSEILRDLQPLPPLGKYTG